MSKDKQIPRRIKDLSQKELELIGDGEDVRYIHNGQFGYVKAFVGGQICFVSAEELLKSPAKGNIDCASVKWTLIGHLP